MTRRKRAACRRISWNEGVSVFCETILEPRTARHRFPRLDKLHERSELKAFTRMPKTFAAAAHVAMDGVLSSDGKSWDGTWRVLSKPHQTPQRFHFDIKQDFSIVRRNYLEILALMSFRCIRRLPFLQALRRQPAHILQRLATQRLKRWHLGFAHGTAILK